MYVAVTHWQQANQDLLADPHDRLVVGGSLAHVHVDDLDAATGLATADQQP
ncbi:hypothetical protein ONA91_31575 [Micromonospora sp. DR5-3]|uniref:hypothetical protein n=1 Tax=unclassified Micromonospora TaxID=2617518 RepID=UPI001651FCAB|nr:MULTISPECIES: hypothetical protein [unclassified Micromonospora]MCW3818987.1 hypothetical protein [Micromonospora sp. DR5-3]